MAINNAINNSLVSATVSGAGGLGAGIVGFDATNHALLVGDGSVNEPIHLNHWQSFTPSWGNITVGNGTSKGAYAQVGKHICFRASLVWGSSTSCAGAMSLTPPIGASSEYTAFNPIALVTFVDNGTNVYQGTLWKDGEMFVYNAAGTYVVGTAPTATVPFTWTTADVLAVSGFFELA